MNPIQPVKFKSVGELLDFLPGQELRIVETLRDIILSTLPECREKLAYNVPYYYRHSRICFVWPSSIPWGGIDSGAAIGFCKGYLLPDEINYLEKGTRKEVYTKTFPAPEEIDPDILRSYLFEAREIDENLYKS